MLNPGWALIIVGLLSAFTGADDKQHHFKITTKRDTDKVEVKVEKDKTVLSIHSPVGISEAKIERMGEQWPDAVFLRLHLKGLESFQVSNGKVSLNATVSSHADDKHRVRIWKDGKVASPLDFTSPFWIEIRMVGGDGRPAKDIPLKDGYFELELPKALFEGKPKSITVKWIDFYRNWAFDSLFRSGRVPRDQLDWHSLPPICVG